MSSSLEKYLQNFPSDYLTYEDVCALLPLTADARYGQIKRALKEDLLIRLTKGVYRKGSYLEKEKPHPFTMSQYMVWPSYVSLESALSHHGLIPEAVYNTTCVTVRRPCSIENPFGLFHYHKLPKKNFFLGVRREEDNNDIFLIATPWKAILDYIFCYKKNWVTINPLAESLRIDLEILPVLDVKFAAQLSEFYHHQRINRFLKSIIRHYHHEY